MRNSGFRLGKLFGIEVTVDWSWLFIFTLVTWNLAGLVFPSAHPEWSRGLNWTLALIASFLFFGSVLAHEFAHSLTAKWFGLPVRRITLFLFGGVANIEREPPSPKAEFLITVVGPLTSLVLGGFFTLLAVARINLAGLDFEQPTAAMAQLDPISTLLLWIGPINLLLAVFNMVPGLPLDGGRILRSIIWASTGSFQTATRWASFAGQLVAWTLIATGVAMILGVSVPIFGTGFIGGLWLVFIGWFLNNAAIQSYRQVMISDLLEGVPVARLMRSDVVAVDPDLSVGQLVYDYVMGTDERGFPVMEADRLVGMVCLDDIRRVPRTEWETTMVRSIMTPADRVAVARPEESADEALSALARKDVRQMPVIENGRVVGILRRRDIMHWLQVQSEFAS
jgi:Zn-dependent protease/CBS domain-containing protein